MQNGASLRTRRLWQAISPSTPLTRPDGMTLDPETNVIYLCCPNYAEVDDDGNKVHPSVLMSIDTEEMLRAQPMTLARCNPST